MNCYGCRHFILHKKPKHELCDSCSKQESLLTDNDNIFKRFYYRYTAEFAIIDLTPVERYIVNFIFLVMLYSLLYQSILLSREYGFLVYRICRKIMKLTLKI